MTSKQFFDWQKSGGTDDVMRLVDCLDRNDIPWCAIGGIAVNHWAEEPMVAKKVDFVVAAERIDRAIDALVVAGFSAERHFWSADFTGNSKVRFQMIIEDIYCAFPERAVPADVHGILLRVASLEDTLKGKLLAWSDKSRRQSKRIKDFADIARLVESHPALWVSLPDELKCQLDVPERR